MSETMLSGVNDAQCECGFGISPHVSRTSDVGIEEVRIEIRPLDGKFNTMQSLLDAVMAKLDITLERMASAPSREEHPSNVDKGRSDSRRSLSLLACSMSNDHVSKLLDFGSAGEKPIVLSTEILCRSQKASS